MSGWRRREGAHRGAHRLSSVANVPASSSIMSTSPQNILGRDHGYVRRREDIVERTNGEVIHGSESSFVVSGELFLRSMQDLLFNDDLAQLPTDQDPPLQQSTTPAKTSIHAETTQEAANGTTSTSVRYRHPSAGLLAGLSNEFRHLLLCHPDLDTTGVVSGESDPARDEQQGSLVTSSPCESSGDCLTHLLSSARRERRLVRLKRMERLEASKMTVKCMATARMMAVQKGADEFKQRFGEEIKRVESDLYGLILRFSAAVKADMAEENRLTAAERDLCEREKERLDMAARFASLAATVEHRTRGNISLRRLTPTHPQYARCMRAATENLKPGFFSDDSPYSALRVLDVYKIDNMYLLEKFQRTVEATESPKVKGLFCHIPDESLEHVVLNGMGSLEGERTTNASSSAHRSAWDGYPMDPIWVARNESPFRCGERGGRGLEDVSHDTAVNVTRPSKPLDFPRAFSRYSTLEEEREYANLPKEIQKRLKNQREFDEGGSASCLRMIALCRVMIGRLSASSSSVPCIYGAGVSADAEGVTAQRSAQRVTFLPGANPQPSVAASPCSSPAEAEFDSMYFPSEKEYRLFNKAYVVPEFIIVHRFVARPRTKPPSSSTVTRRPRAVTFGGGGLRTAVGTQEGERRDRSDGDSVGAPQSTAFVVARKQTAMNRAQPSAPVVFVAPSSFEGLSRPLADWTRDDGVGLGKTGGSGVEAVWIRGGERQERGNARVDRESIMNTVEDTFERFWFRLDELRKLQQDTVVKSATRAQVS